MEHYVSGQSRDLKFSPFIADNIWLYTFIKSALETCCITDFNWHVSVSILFQIFLPPRMLCDQPQHYCEQCSKSVVSKEGYDKHINAHRGIYKYTCETCNKGFACTNNLKEHLTGHTGVNYFTCKTCATSFRMYRQLQKHRAKCEIKWHLNSLMDCPSGNKSIFLCKEY